MTTFSDMYKSAYFSIKIIESNLLFFYTSFYISQKPFVEIRWVIVYYISA